MSSPSGSTGHSASSPGTLPGTSGERGEQMQGDISAYLNFQDAASITLQIVISPLKETKTQDDTGDQL